MRELIFVLLFVVFLFSEALLGQASLKGSSLSLRKQNLVADIAGYERIKDDATLERLKSAGVLKRIPGTVRIDPRLDEKWHWVRQPVVDFLEDYGVNFIDLWGRFFKLNSAVRTYARQIEIMESGNENARLPLKGPRTSPHFTGATIDIAKMPLSEGELLWWRKTLAYLEEEHLVEATEEEKQLVFHINIFEDYSWARAQGKTKP